MTSLGHEALTIGTSNTLLIVAPRSPREILVRSLFASVLTLAVEAISVEASFFELGGNSLRAVGLARCLTSTLDCPVGVADVMQRPTVAELAGRGGKLNALPPPLLCEIDGAQLLSAVHAVSWNQSQLLTVHLVGGVQ